MQMSGGRGPTIRVATKRRSHRVSGSGDRDHDHDEGCEQECLPNSRGTPSNHFFTSTPVSVETLDPKTQTCMDGATR